MNKPDSTPQARRPTGRPPGSVERLRRNRVVTMVTDSELNQLNVLAKTENKSLSSIVYEILSRLLSDPRTKS